MQQHYRDLQQPRSFSWHRSLLNLFFPVDFSSVFSKTAFRLPSLYFLAKAVAIWLALLLQASDPSLYSRFFWLRPVGEWIAQVKLEDVCWRTFMSACFALCIGTLPTGLEGLNINDNAPFNLVRSSMHTASEEHVVTYVRSLHSHSNSMWSRPHMFRPRRIRPCPGQMSTSSLLSFSHSYSLR